MKAKAWVYLLLRDGWRLAASRAGDLVRSAVTGRGLAAFLGAHWDAHSLGRYDRIKGGGSMERSALGGRQ